MRVFVAVVEEESFTAAAARLGATQSGVSQQIAKLEQALGARLIERGARGTVATPAGRQLYARSIVLLRDLSAIERGVAGYGRGATGQVTLGVMPALTRAQVGPVLRRYLADNPNVAVNIVERASSELIEDVIDDRLDGALIPSFDAPPSLRCRPIGRTREVLIAGASDDHAHLRPIDVRSLSPVRLILQSEGHIRRRKVLTYLRSRGVEFEALMALDTVFGTLEFVRNSDFMTIVPAVMVAPEIEDGAMSVRPLAPDGLELEVMAVEPARRESSPILADLFDLFEQSIAAFESELEAILAARRHA